MKGLVISGGGSKGAFAGGLAEYLINVKKTAYKILIGSSTGSLLVPLLSIGEIEKLKKVFTSVTQDDIFNNCPFIISNKKGILKSRINHIGIIKMFLKKKKTFGESENLKNLIFKTITTADFEKIRHSGHQVIITVSNLTSMNVEYKTAGDCGYKDFCEWIWASTSLVPFMSLVSKDGCDYADGGMGDIIPIYHAIQSGATDIDVIVLKSDRSLVKSPVIHNALDLTYRVFGFMLNQIVLDDITIGKLEGMNKKVKLNFFRPPEELTSNSLLFEPGQMKAWWELGYQYGKLNIPHSKFIHIP
jgi:predicted patatin/cPLA2 family phospholipase